MGGTELHGFLWILCYQMYEEHDPSIDGDALTLVPYWNPGAEGSVLHEHRVDKRAAGAGAICTRTGVQAEGMYVGICRQLLHVRLPPTSTLAR